jgi:tetratricopeptide (TPR) repeat protein
MSRRLSTVPSRADIERYYLHNNIGFALNQLERYAEAELHLREAVRLDADRPNAFKNMGLSLEGQGKFGEAALCYIAATRADASDPRALKHLEELAKRHKEAYADVADLDYQLFKCREAVEYALSQQPQSRFISSKKGGQGKPN